MLSKQEIIYIRLWYDKIKELCPDWLCPIDDDLDDTLARILDNLEKPVVIQQVFRESDTRSDRDRIKAIIEEELAKALAGVFHEVEKQVSERNIL